MQGDLKEYMVRCTNLKKGLHIHFKPHHCLNFRSKLISFKDVDKLEDESNNILKSSLKDLEKMFGEELSIEVNNLWIIKGSKR